MVRAEIKYKYKLYTNIGNFTMVTSLVASDLQDLLNEDKWLRVKDEKDAPIQLKSRSVLAYECVQRWKD